MNNPPVKDCVGVFAARGATVWRCQREAPSSADGLPVSVDGLPDWRQHAAGAAECEREAPVTSGHALLASRWASTTLRTHAGPRWLHAAAADILLCKASASVIEGCFTIRYTFHMHGNLKEPACSF